MNKSETMAQAARGEGCLGRSQDGEPVFVLVGRDQIAPGVVREWAKRFRKLRESTNTFDDVAAMKFGEALALADSMDRWRNANGGGKVPD